MASEPRVRAGDAEDSREWAKRRIAIHDDPKIVVNGSVGRLLAYVRVVKEVGVVSLVTALCIGWLFGVWKIPIVDTYLGSLIASDVAILKGLDDVKRQLGEADRDRLRIVHNMFTAMRINCENVARAAKDQASFAACANIHE